MENGIIKKLIYTLGIFFILISNSVAFASYLANGFFVNDKSINFEGITGTTKCYGTLPYPEVAHTEQELAAIVNDEIQDFIKVYAICNEGDKKNFSVTYDIPESASIQFFSIIWTSKKDDQLHRIDALNFSMQNSDLLSPEDIFVDNSSSFMSQMINLSEGHLGQEDNWEQFLEKVTNRDIQFYISKKDWHIVFNGTPKLNKVVDVKIPQYFLQGSDVTSEE